MSPAVTDRASARTRGYGCGSCSYSASVARGQRLRARVGPQLVGGRCAHARLHRVDRPAPQADRRDDGVGVGGEEARGREPHLLGAVRVEDEVGGGTRDVEGLQVGLAEGSVALRGRQHEGRAPRSRCEGRRRSTPAGALPRVEGLAHPVRGTVGPDLHHELVAQLAPQGGVEAPREARGSRRRGSGCSGCRPATAGRATPQSPARSPGTPTAPPSPARGKEGDPRRHDGSREHQEDGGRRRGHGRRAPPPAPGRDASAPARRDPHLVRAHRPKPTQATT